MSEPADKMPAASVSERRSGVVALLFTDVAGSTLLKRELGDRPAVDLLQAHHRLLRDVLSTFPGAEEVDTAGDSFFLTFPVPSEAVVFALRLQARLRQFNEGLSVPVRDRVGLHLGEVVLALGPSGQCKAQGIQVDTCARVMSLAQPGQILLTRSVFDNARQSLKGEELPGRLEWLNHGRFELKGLGEPVEVCEVRLADAEKLSPPTTSEKARRVEAAEGEAVLGWRPANGNVVPNTQWSLERKLGEGGFGEVWLGRHLIMKERRVFKFCFRAERVRSLKREMTLFRLIKERIGDHPNIVALREVKLDQPPFYVEMDYAEGQDLGGWCQSQGGATRVPLEVKLEIVARVADALQAAHDAGVVHRDIKPGNILVADAATSGTEVPAARQPRWVKLTDFGIGQVVSEEALAGLTRAGFTQTMLASGSPQTGTRLYMAPELLEGRPASVRSDIYSLGVVLYQFLVGDFRRSLTTDWTKHINDPLLRQDLELCFAGNPEDRFAGAAQLARHLRSWQSRKAELDRLEAERAERAIYKRQAERRRRALLVGALVGVMLVALAAALGYGLHQARVERQRFRLAAYASDMKAAQVAYDQNNRGLAATLLARQRPARREDDLRGVEWRYLSMLGRGSESRSLPHGASVLDVAISPDGRLLAASTWDELVHVWDVASEKHVQYFRKGGSASPKRGVAFTADSKWFLFRGLGGIEVRDTDNWSLVTNVPCGRVSPFVLSANGRRLVFEGLRGEMCAYDLRTWDCQTLPNHSVLLYGLAVNAAGTVVAMTDRGPSNPGAVVLWDLRTDQSVVLEGPTNVLTFAISPNGQWLASAYSDGRLTLWDVASRKAVRSWRPHRAEVEGLAFSPDNQHLASGGADQFIAIWDITSTNPPEILRGHQRQVTSLAYFNNGRQLVSGSEDATAKLWDLSVPSARDTSKRLGYPATAVPVCPSPDAAGLFTIDPVEKSAALWSLQSGQRLWSFPDAKLQELGCRDTYYFCKRQWAVGFGSNQVLYLCDMPSQKVVQSIPLPAARLNPQLLSSDGRWLLAKTPDELRLFDLKARQAVPGFKADIANRIWTACFSDDGRWLAYAGARSKGHTICVRDLQTGTERMFSGRSILVGALRFSPDASLLAVGDWDSNVELWSVKSGQSLWLARQAHQSSVTACMFSKDGKTLITSGFDLTLRFWSVAAGQEVLLIEDAIPLSEKSLHDFWETIHRPQVEINPVEDTLVWQELGGRTRVISLPTMAEIDQEITRERQRASQAVDESVAAKARLPK